MARIRTVKPDFWGSSDIAPRLSRDARLLVLGLISMADDDGRFLASPNAVVGHVFPNDDNVSAAQIRRWLAEVSDRGEPVYLYDVDGVRYGCFPKWHRHQRINRYTPSKLPSPDVECVSRGSGGGDEE